MTGGGMFAGSKLGAGEAKSSPDSGPIDHLRVVDRIFSGEIRDRLTPTRCHPRVASLLLEGWRSYLLSTSLCEPGETLGPCGLGSSVVASLLEGIAWYMEIRWSECGGTSPEGATVMGNRHLVNVPLLPFCFFVLLLHVFVLLLQQFLSFPDSRMYSVVAIFI
jgi:hypothetical protein